MIYKKIPIEFINEPEKKELNLQEVQKQIEKIIPKHLLDNVEAIYLTNSRGYDDCDVVFKEGCLYLDNNLINKDTILPLVAHGVAWSLEEQFRDEIFDETFEEVFLIESQEDETQEEFWRWCFENYFFDEEEIKKFPNIYKTINKIVLNK